MACGNTIQPGSSGLGSRDIDRLYNNRNCPEPDGAEAVSQSDGRPKTGANASAFLRPNGQDKYQRFTQEAIKKCMLANNDGSNVTLLGVHLNESGWGEVDFVVKLGSGGVFYYRYYRGPGCEVKETSLSYWTKKDAEVLLAQFD